MKNTIFFKMIKTLKIFFSERIVNFKDWKDDIEKWVRM